MFIEISATQWLDVASFCWLVEKLIRVCIWWHARDAKRWAEKFGEQFRDRLPPF